MSVKMRQEVERKIATAIVNDALKAGFHIQVNNGEEKSSIFGAAVHVLDAMFKTDEEHLFMYNSDGSHAGWVFFVYWNDGYDVVNDYSIGLEPIMKTAQKISDYYAD